MQLNLDFSSLVPPGVQGLTILRVEYYIELPQSSQDMLNGNAQNYRITSWLGASDLRTIPAVKFGQNVLDHTLQDGPINLLCPDFNLTSAKTDSTNIEAEISSKIIRLATPSVLESLFNQLCPGYSKEPHAALDHVRQTYNDANGSKVFSCVYDYYTQILAASRPFIDMETLPVSVCQAFIDGLDQHLSAGFRTHFPTYSIPQDCSAIHQRTVLQEMLQAALRAKSEYNNIRAIASEASGFGSGQTFSAQVNASQAEKTISKYRDDTSNKAGSSSKGPLCCYGCGGPHPWSLLKQGIHVIKCPTASNPGIQENAKRTIERIRSKRKKKQANFTKHINLAKTNFSDFDKEGQDHILLQALTLCSQASESASVASSITGVTGGTTAVSPSKSAGSKRVVFLYDAIALNTDVQRPVLPVGIQSIMPHINLQLGTDVKDASSPSIRCVVDTAAALCTGNYHFFAAIAKKSHSASLRYISQRTTLQSSYRGLSKITLMPSQQIYPSHFNFIYLISPRMEAQPLLSWLPGPK